MREVDTNLLGRKVWILLQGGYHRIGVLKYITFNYLLIEEVWGGQRTDVIVTAKEIVKVEQFREKRWRRNG